MQLQMNQLRLTNNRYNFKTSRKLPIFLEEFGQFILVLNILGFLGSQNKGIKWEAYTFGNMGTPLETCVHNLGPIDGEHVNVLWGTTNWVHGNNSSRTCHQAHVNISMGTWEHGIGNLGHASLQT